MVPRIVGLLRVKNEARWITRVVKSIQSVCERVIVLDDHSADSTPDMCRGLGCTVIDSPFDGIHEARDKDYLLSKVWESGFKIGDWCLMIDGDEILHQDDVGALWEVASTPAASPCYSFQVVYLWDREDQVRVDRWYREFRRPSLFRLTSYDLTFRRTGSGGNFHCSSAPSALLTSIVPAPVRLLHMGYLHRDDRLRKYEFYNSVDPGNDYEDHYRHMVIGDIFPAESQFKWAGPLELAPLQ